MMKEFFSWLDKKFSHPLTLLFFLLGCAFLFFSFTTGYKDIGLASGPYLRPISITIGLMLLATSVFLYYKPPKFPTNTFEAHRTLDVNEENVVLILPASLRSEFCRPFSARKDRQNDSVKRLLDFIEKETKHREKIPQEDFDKEFPNHVFWMLEVVVWMGFVEKENSGRRRCGKPLFDYWLSPEYNKELGR